MKYPLDFILVTLISIHVKADVIGKRATLPPVPETNFNNSKECLIHNHGYMFEYLYTGDETDLDETYFHNRNVYTVPLNYVSNYEQIKWRLLLAPAKNEKLLDKDESEKIYYIKSLYDKRDGTSFYLCASDVFADSFFKKRHKVHLWRMNSPLTYEKREKHCEWYLKKQPHNHIIQTIRNVYYNKDPFYAASYFYKNHPIKRSVFVWKGIPMNKEFFWQIDCTKGEFLTY